MTRLRQRMLDEPEDREPEDEDLATNWKSSESHEPTPSRPEPTPTPARIDRPAAAVPQSPSMRPNGNTTNRAVEPGETPSFVPGGSFGRFQRL